MDWKYTRITQKEVSREKVIGIQFLKSVRLNKYVLRLPKVGNSRKNGGDSILENMLELVKHMNLKILFI